MCCPRALVTGAILAFKFFELDGFQIVQVHAACPELSLEERLLEDFRPNGPQQQRVQRTLSGDQLRLRVLVEHLQHELLWNGGKNQGRQL